MDTDKMRKSLKHKESNCSKLEGMFLRARHSQIRRYPTVDELGAAYNASFSVEELSEFMDAFRLFDKDETGYISTDEVRAVMKSLGKDPSEPEMDSKLRELDDTGNGIIEFEEFIQLMNAFVDVADTQEELADVFRLIDQDDDGYINKGDLKQVLDYVGLKLSHDEIEDMLTAGDHKAGELDAKLSYDDFLKLLL